MTPPRGGSPSHPPFEPAAITKASCALHSAKCAARSITYSVPVCDVGSRICAFRNMFLSTPKRFPYGSSVNSWALRAAGACLLRPTAPELFLAAGGFEAEVPLAKDAGPSHPFSCRKLYRNTNNVPTKSPAIHKEKIRCACAVCLEGCGECPCESPVRPPCSRKRKNVSRGYNLVGFTYFRWYEAKQAPVKFVRSDVSLSPPEVVSVCS